MDTTIMSATTLSQPSQLLEKTYTKRLAERQVREILTDDGKKMVNPFVKLSPPSTAPGIFGTIGALLLMWLSQLLVVVCAALSQFLFIAILLIVWVVIYYIRYYFGDGVQLIEDSYELTALVVNYGIDKGNYLFVLAQPFLPIYNLYLYVSKIMNQIFWLVMTPSFVVYLLHKVIDLIWQLMPVVIDVVVALMQVFVSLIPAIVQIVALLFNDAIIQTVLNLIQMGINIILALVPVLPQLLPIIAIFVRLVIEQLQEYFVILLDIAIQIINAVMGFVIGLVPDLVAAANAISVGIANAPQPVEPFDYIVIIFTSMIGLIIKVVVGIVALLATLVTSNLVKIIAFAVSFLDAMSRLIAPIVIAILNIFTTQLPVIISLMIVLIQALIDTVPMLYNVLQELILSGVFENIIAAIIEGVTAPHSPTFLTSVFEKFGEVLETNLYYAIEAVKTLVNIAVILLPIAIDMITQIVSSNLLMVTLRGFVSLISVLIPIAVNLFITLMMDVFFDVILRIFLENFADLFAALLETVVILLAALAPFLLHVLVSILVGLIKILPKLGTLLVVILAGTPIFIVQLLAATLQLISDLLFSENFIFVILKTVVAIINAFTKTLLGFEIAPLQFVVDFFFKIINPFFAMIGASVDLDASGVNLDDVNLDVSGTSSSGGGGNSTSGGGGGGNSTSGGTAPPTRDEALDAFFEKLDFLISKIGIVVRYLGYVFYVFKYIAIGIEYTLKYAIVAVEYIIKPAVCTIDATCCVFAHGDCCFDIFCHCACTDYDQWGCPPPGYSCFF